MAPRRKGSSATQVPQKRIISARPQTESAKLYDPVSPNTALIRLVHEMVSARIRHRTLLDVLAQGAYSWDAYVRRYKELIYRDAQALYGQMILEEADFIKLFSEWKSDDTARYAVDLAILEAEVATSAPATKPKRKRQAKPSA